MENFNLVLEKARAPFFMWAAHDDIREPQYIETMVSALMQDGNAVLAFSRFDNIDETGNCVKVYSEEWGNILSGSLYKKLSRFSLMDDSGTQKANGPIYGLMRREILSKCGGMQSVRDAVFCGEDVHLLLRMLCHGQFVFVGDTLFHYRVRVHLGLPKGLSPIVYLLNRILRPTKGHRGSLLLYFKRNHAFHREMRRVVTGSELSKSDRIKLNARLYLKEFFDPIVTIPKAAFHELFRSR